jgi:hypothetical protein
MGSWFETGWGPRIKLRQREGRFLIYIEESGLNKKPRRVRTCSPKVRPDLESTSAGRALGFAEPSGWNLYFRLYHDAVKIEQAIDFLKHLRRHVKGSLLLLRNLAPPSATNSMSPCLGRPYLYIVFAVNAFSSSALSGAQPGFVSNIRT